MNHANQALYLLLSTVAWIASQQRWINIWQAQHWPQISCHPNVNYLTFFFFLQGQSNGIKIFSEEVVTPNSCQLYGVFPQRSCFSMVQNANWEQNIVRENKIPSTEIRNTQPTKHKPLLIIIYTHNHLKLNTNGCIYCKLFRIAPNTAQFFWLKSISCSKHHGCSCFFFTLALWGSTE